MRTARWTQLQVRGDLPSAWWSEVGSPEVGGEADRGEWRCGVEREDHGRGLTNSCRKPPGAERDSDGLAGWRGACLFIDREARTTARSPPRPGSTSCKLFPVLRPRGPTSLKPFL